MPKKGQVTILIILGLILFIIIILGFFFRSELVDMFQKSGFVEESVLPNEVQELKDQIYSCLYDLSNDAVYNLGLTGGYLYETPLSFLEYDIYAVPYLYDKGQNNVVDLTVWENDLASYMKANYQNCVKDYENFDLSYGNIEPIVVIEDLVTWDIYWPISVKYNSIEYRINDFSLNQNIYLFQLHEALNFIIENQIYDNKLCVSCITDITLDYNLEINFENLDEGTLFMITDKNSQVYDEDFQFVFASRYA
ncbi:MAG: hypothetical protein ABIF40_03915 [archaeon]